MKVSFKHVSKNFGLITALKDIDFDVESGEFVFIVGPSGAGKSTLLKLILKQYKPSSGEVLIDGINLSTANKHETDRIRKKIGLIFQDSQLIPDKSVEENISLALDIVGFPKNKIQSKIDEVIKKVGLSNRRFLFPAQLSGGEMQRAALARALAVEPQIILADEPTGNLDIENSWNLIKLLKDINENNKTTIIMTTHNLDIVESLDKRVITIRNGSAEKDISSEEKNQELHKGHKKNEHI